MQQINACFYVLIQKTECRREQKKRNWRILILIRVAFDCDVFCRFCKGRERKLNKPKNISYGIDLQSPDVFIGAGSGFSTSSGTISSAASFGAPLQEFLDPL